MVTSKASQKSWSGYEATLLCKSSVIDSVLYITLRTGTVMNSDSRKTSDWFKVEWGLSIQASHID